MGAPPKPAWPSADERDSLNWTLIYPRPDLGEGHGSLLVRRQREWDRAEAKRLANLRMMENRTALIRAQYGKKSNASDDNG